MSLCKFNRFIHSWNESIGIAWTCLTAYFQVSKRQFMFHNYILLTHSEMCIKRNEIRSLFHLLLCHVIFMKSHLTLCWMAFSNCVVFATWKWLVRATNENYFFGTSSVLASGKIHGFCYAIKNENEQRVTDWMFCKYNDSKYWFRFD